MIIKQLAVFLENKGGRLNEVSQLLGDAGINMSAFSVADTSEFGILRMIVSDPDKAYQVLKAASFSVKLTEVVCLSSPNVPGALAKALNILSSEEVFIEYLYAFSMDKQSANIVLKPADIEKCIKVLQDHQMELVRASDLYKL
ncbi:acetolactate synthase [uncultured Sunxiuqinia sp.]|uniref:acetolactate synthase n=1 Tax=Sunxiuqinia rutila TaxID=1397841 RepID=UPI0026185706|nr:acetolactate synthase [uncultured Sunxiuqinia sp.]